MGINREEVAVFEQISVNIAAKVVQIIVIAQPGKPSTIFAKKEPTKLENPDILALFKIFNLRNLNSFSSKSQNNLKIQSRQP